MCLTSARLGVSSEVGLPSVRAAPNLVAARLAIGTDSALLHLALLATAILATSVVVFILRS